MMKESIFKDPAMGEFYKANLLKLATYLEGLPPSYGGFEMGVFYDELDPCTEEPSYAFPHEVGGGEYPCGTVACAIGHGPAAGVAPFSEEGWTHYSELSFGLDSNSPEWDWCFSEYWSEVDNTPQGAARRIKKLLGGYVVPSDIEEALCRKAVPLDYKEQIEEKGYFKADSERLGEGVDWWT